MTTELVTVENEGLGLVTQIAALDIKDQASLERAAVLLSTARKYIKQVEEVFDPVIASAMEALATARQQKKALIEPAQTAEKALKEKIQNFHVMLQDREEEERRRVIDATREGEIVFVPPVESQKQKVKGLSIREGWKAEVVELMELVTAVACLEAPLDLVQANQDALNRLARSLRGSMNIPGVRAYPTQTVVSRS